MADGALGVGVIIRIAVRSGRLPEMMILTRDFLGVGFALGFALGFVALFWLRRTGQLSPR